MSYDENVLAVRRFLYRWNEETWHREMEAGLTPKESGAWTDYQVAFLKENYGTWKNEDLAAELQRTCGSIIHKAFSLGLKKDDTKLRWTPEDIQKMFSLKEQGYTWAEVGKVLGRTKGAVGAKDRELAKKRQLCYT